METTIQCTTNSPTSTATGSDTSDTDAVDSSSPRVYFGPLQSPENKFIARDVVRRQALKTGAFGSPVRRSPRLSCLPPPQPPQDGRNIRDQDEGSDDDSDSMNDVTAQLSREETPENDPLPADEPSSVLASKIMRAQDNPSPPPQHSAHPGINYVPGKDGQFPLLDISAPPSPFRAINLFERLNQLTAPPFEPLRGSPALALGNPPPELPKPGNISQPDLISFESCSPSAISLPEHTQSAAPAALHTNHNMSSTHSTVDDLLSQSPERGSALISCVGTVEQEASSSKIGSGIYEQTITEVIGSSSIPIVISSFDPNTTSISDDRPRTPLRRSARQSGTRTPPLTPGVKACLSPRLKGKALSPTAEENVLSKEDCNEAELSSSAGSDDLSTVKERHKGKRRATSNKGVNNASYQKLGSLSPRSADVLTGLFTSIEPTPSIEQTFVSLESAQSVPTPSTPPPAPKPSAPHPDFSRTVVRRPVLAPTPVRAHGNVLNMPSSHKFSCTVEDTSSTPARRVPIQDALESGAPSIQKAVHFSTVVDLSQTGRSLTIRAPVFTRPALDDPARSPAKRVPIADLLASPAKGTQSSRSPTRLGLRVRSASVEPRPIGPIPSRSRSVEPSPTFSRLDVGGKGKEPIFPKLSATPRSGSKLPFPLIPSQKSRSGLPHAIPEEDENVVTRARSPAASPGTAVQSCTKSQLKVPSASSRIPRIGNKPYTRPPSKNGKVSTNATPSKASTIAPPFKAARNGSGTGNSSSGESSAQIANGQQPQNISVPAALKRKRGAEAVISPPSSQLVMMRQVVPGMLGGKYAPKPTPNSASRFQAPAEVSPQKPPPPMKFRKVVDGMMSVRYAPAKSNSTEPEPVESLPLPRSHILTEPSSSLTEGPPEEKFPFTPPPGSHEDDTSNFSPTRAEVSETNIALDFSPSYDNVDRDRPSSHLRRTPRRRKPAQQQYVLDVFSTNNPSRPLPVRRKPHPRTEADGFMGLSATALKALTTSNTTKNQQTVATLEIEVIRKGGLRPESPTVKVRTILQKQRDERDVRRRERAERRLRKSEDDVGASDTEGATEYGDESLLDTHTDHDGNDGAIPRKHRRGPGEDEDYETPQRPECSVKKLRFGEVVDEETKAVKQVKWHRGLSTAVYLDDLHPKPTSQPKDFVIGKGCLAPTSKDLRLDPLGNLLGTVNDLSPELIPEQIVVKKFLYDNDVEPEPVPVKITRSRSKKGRS
ncbi:hypothetical protein PAXRUDRAFT_8226 [Paxillus rubicundulus Ve08.2h10]|uniref:Uncharacterized protein n=1 Tax=Paxillus rubicundulus Ve08.2h10 TaxID=930991 RepID=A0A0D0DXT6_9AGAM|nr:hypothetical protein PAXRUDRAFT_8226 [Paxillus rubicundulus Ve08.2h10]